MVACIRIKEFERLIERSFEHHVVPIVDSSLPSLSFRCLPFTSLNARVRLYRLAVTRSPFAVGTCLTLLQCLHLWIYSLAILGDMSSYNTSASVS